MVFLSPSCFNGHFPVGSGLAGTRMFPFWILLELRVMQVVVITAAIRRVKLQSKCHQQKKHPAFTGRMPFLSPTNSVKALKGIKYNAL